jgi:signal transduction histidine kinase/ligand-binding sensor domain-containing protein/DNA-binding response OmpR family regulator
MPILGIVRSATAAASLACLVALQTYGQTGRVAQNATGSRTETWVHESWTVKDGLPVNSVNQILQDREGYIWAATFDGLVRFDGVRFTVFNSANSDNLPSDRIVSLAEGRDGLLWMATEQGHIVRFRAGQFRNIAFNDGKLGGLPMLYVDPLGTVWVGTTEGLWTVRDDRLVRVGRGTLDARVTAIRRRRDGTLWVGTNRRGIFRVTADSVVVKIATSPDIDSTYIHRLVEDASGTLWIAGDAGLWSLRDRLVAVKTVPPLSFATTVFQVPATGTIYAQTRAGVYRVDSGAAVLVRPSSTIFGLRLWTDSDAVWTVGDEDVYRDNQRVLTIAEGRTLSSALFDREGSLWLGTDAGGLQRLKRAVFTTYSTAEGVGYPNVYATYADRAGTIWLGTWGNGASRLDPATGRATVFNIGARPANVNSFYEDASGTMWIGTAIGDGGLFACVPSTSVCSQQGSRDLRQRAVFALHGDREGRMWVGASELLLRFDGKSWTTFSPASGGPQASVRAFAETRDGALWMGTNGAGLTRYGDGSFTSVTRANGLPSDLVRSLYEDADGWLWVGTEGRGLARLDPRAWSPAASTAPNAARRIVRIDTKDGLFDEVIHQILEDDSGRLWMNTNRGIFWVARAELNAFADGRVSRIHSTAYTERDGIRNREGNGGVQPAGARSADGRLWFPTQDGVVVVDPSTVRGDRIAPPLVVEQVLAGGAALRPERDSIALAPNERDLQIEYTALTFLEPTNVRFRYRLDPYDSTWVDAGNRRTAFYTKVPPGRYRFVVQASDAGSGWYEPGTTLAVRVVPRVWETRAFRWAMAAASAMLLLIAVRFREARLRARAMHLEHIVDERTATLRDRERELADRNDRLQSLDHAKTRFFANVSHELRTPLTLTIGPLEDLRARANGDPQVERWLDIALRNSRRLLRLVNQILDVAKLEAGAMHLVPRQIDLVPFVRGIVGAFTSVADRTGIGLTVDTGERLSGAFDPDAVEKILTNLLSNAIKFTPDGGVVHVALSSEDDLAKLVVRDSGPGIPPDQLAHVFERFYQADESATRTQPGTGIGLSLVRELIELHGGTIGVESTSGGTTFTALIPPLRTAEDVQPSTGRMPNVDPHAIVVTAEQSPPADAELEEQTAIDDNVPTLLIVDDSADLRRYVRDHFSSRFRVLEAANGNAGVELAQRHLPDVVLSDVMMPVADGHELVRTLRASPATDFLSIVLLTAQADDAQRLKGLEGGADDYIPKPFEMRELDVRVRNLIASRRRLRERFASPPAAAPSVRTPSISLADQTYMTRVRDAVRVRLGDPEFNVGGLADALAQDRSRLFRRVRELFGMSPSDLIRRMRVEEGERLLTESSATVTEVAYASGFNSLSYFCRCFQDVYGATPADYRTRVIPGRHSSLRSE